MSVLLKPTKIKDAPLVRHKYKTTYYWAPQGYASGVQFKLKGANCKRYTTPACGKCDEWIEFMDITGGPIDGCNPLEKCLDCEMREPCPCFDVAKALEEMVTCACGCGREFRKKSGGHKYATPECRQGKGRQIWGWAMCPRCGDRFQKRASNHVYCEGRCRTAASYARKKEEGDDPG